MRKQFLTVKLVETEEMTKAEFYKSIGVRMPECENGEEKVFKIFYKEGYKSMCPKDIFLKQAYEIEENSVTCQLVESFIKNKEITTEKIFGKISTVLRYELVNGFVGIEVSSCVDEKNYSKEIGEKILLDRLHNQIWQGLGFALGMAKGKQ